MNELITLIYIVVMEMVTVLRGYDDDDEEEEEDEGNVNKGDEFIHEWCQICWHSCSGLFKVVVIIE